jgi:hypothetical protein
MSRSGSGWVTLGCVALLGASGCASATPRRFPLRDAVWIDDDLRPVAVPCHEEEDDGKKKTLCRPKEYVSPFLWDTADKTVFRPVVGFFAMDFGFEAKNVNALDEVPNSSWFTNRLGVETMTPEEIAVGSCPARMLDPKTDPDGSWVVDQGKPNGANPGFRVNVKGVGKFMLKADTKGEGDKATGATAIASRIYHAAGYWSVCDTVVYVPRRLLSLTPGLKFADNSGIEREFDQKALDNVLDNAVQKGDLVRMLASQWLPGRTIGPFKYEDTRDDDPNDVIPHEDRRDLRGARLLAAWLGHFDSREQNSMTTWHSVDEKNKDSSPGHTIHWYIDLGDCFGSTWEWDQLTRRINKSYYFDPADVAFDLVTLGIPTRPWDESKKTPGAEQFAYFPNDAFEPEAWKGGYPNPAFARMTELDGAWMARIISRFSDEDILRVVEVGQYQTPGHTELIAKTLIKRRDAIRKRYFQNLSPLTEVTAEGTEVCATDLARVAGTWPEASFRYGAAAWTGEELDENRQLKVTVKDGGRVCVDVGRVAKSDSAKPDDPSRYVVVDVQNGVAEGPLRAHFYDLGPAKGLKLVGIERPDDADPTW